MMMSLAQLRDFPPPTRGLKNYIVSLRNKHTPPKSEFNVSLTQLLSESDFVEMQRWETEQIICRKKLRDELNKESCESSISWLVKASYEPTRQQNSKVDYEKQFISGKNLFGGKVSDSAYKDDDSCCNYDHGYIYDDNYNNQEDAFDDVAIPPSPELKKIKEVSVSSPVFIDTSVTTAATIRQDCDLIHLTEYKDCQAMQENQAVIKLLYNSILSQLEQNRKHKSALQRARRAKAKAKESKCQSGHEVEREEVVLMTSSIATDEHQEKLSKSDSMADFCVGDSVEEVEHKYQTYLQAKAEQRRKKTDAQRRARAAKRRDNTTAKRRDNTCDSANVQVI